MLQVLTQPVLGGASTQDTVPPARLAGDHPIPPRSTGWSLGGGCGRGGNTLKAAGSGRRIPTRQLSCRLCPTAPGLRLLPDLESSRWESHPSSHGRGWQHAAQGDHRGGGRLAPCPGAPGTSSHQRPFSLKSPWLGAVRRDRGGTRSPPPPTWVTHPRLPMRRAAGRAALAARDGQRAAKVAPVPAPRGEAGLTAGAGQEVSGLSGCYRVEGEEGGGTSKSIWETLPANPQAGAAAPGVLRSRVALPPSLPACSFPASLPAS